MRLAVYCDYPYRLVDGQLYADQAVALFLGRLTAYSERLAMVGRLDVSSGSFPYRIDGADLVALPHYDSAADPRALARAAPAAVSRFWRLLGEVDVALIFGPAPVAIVFALLTLARRRRLVLGVRQDLPRLFDHRYPDRPVMRLAARLLEATFRLLARRVPVVVVGPALARHYGHARALHETFVSLLGEERLACAADDHRRYDGPELRMLSVGRIDPEKNPLLLADVLAAAVGDDPRWRLDVCGDGPLLGALAQRARELGVADRMTLHGHVPVDAGLVELYDRSHAFLHVSHTEGLPQVLLEAFARRLPVVGTAVGGVPDLVQGCGLLVAPRDAPAAAAALQRLVSDGPLRGQLVARAMERITEHTRERELDTLAAFLTEGRR
jgi:glycosyltransferase involved in cell wall biosynthesis